MKKSTFLALVCTLFFCQSMFAQSEAQEITYVEDPSQGYLFNKMKDNWFISGEVGAGIYFSPNDCNRSVWDRWSPAGSIYVGKWFSPIIGARLGVNFLQTQGMADAQNPESYPGILWDRGLVNGHYRQVFSHVGPVFDVMFNLTNMCCGYKPGRIYNLTAYAGAGGYWTFGKEFSGDLYDNPVDEGWGYLESDRVMTFRAGIINAFNVSKQVQLYLDIRYSGIDNHADEPGNYWNKTAHDLQAYIGATYLFKKREWSAPIVPVCPEPENCDPLRARLEAADARIADLEDQLKACLERPIEKEIVEEKAPLATIYYPINVSRLTSKDIAICKACAQVMLDNPDTKYVITGWADNYTGNDQINTRLRKNRVAGVEKQLLRAGVPAEQFEATINHNNLVDLGEKYQALGRAVTIEEAE
jgi:outer membrane protein OmpA-like peptidoglycan-associated protein